MRIPFASFLIVVALAAPAAAESRAHVRALGGVTFGGETAPVFGGSLGVRVTHGLSLTAEVGSMRNITSSNLEDTIDAAVDLANRVLPVDVEVDVKQRAFYGLAGLRYDLPGESIHPYVEAGGGFASLTVDVNASVAGFNLPNFLDDEIGLREETKGLVAVGGGIALDMSENAGLDLGYRYKRVLADDAININEVYGAIRIGF